MERQTVESSQIRSIGFDPAARKMEVEFKPGSIYQYDNVEQEVFDAFLASESKGKFFGATIKNDAVKYPFTKVRASDRELQKAETGDAS